MSMEPGDVQEQCKACFRMLDLQAEHIYNIDFRGLLCRECGNEYGDGMPGPDPDDLEEE